MKHYCVVALHTKPAPPPVPGIEQKVWLKLLGITFHEDPQIVIGIFLSTACFLELLVICLFLGYASITVILKISFDSKLFDSLIMSLFLYGLEVWSSGYQCRYLDQIDTFFQRAYSFSYTNKINLISDVITSRDIGLFNRIISE